MSTYTPKDQWHGGIRQFDINEIVEGGSAGLDNIPHQELADNLFHLMKRLEVVERKGGVITLPNAPSITTTDQGTGSGLVVFKHNNPATNGQSIEVVQTIRSGTGCSNLINITKTGVFADGQMTIGFAKPAEVAIADICEVKYVATNVVTNQSATIVVQGAKSEAVMVFPKPTIDIVGYKDGDSNASHFQGENLKVNMTNAQNGHEIYIQRSAEALNSNTTSGWGNDGSGIVQWGTANIKGIHSKLYTAAHYQELAQNMYTMTYVATDNDTKNTAQEARFLRKVRGASWHKKPRLPYQADAAFYGFGETVKLTDDTVDIYFIASGLTKAQAEGKELTISLYTIYTKQGTGGGIGTGQVPTADRPSLVDVARATVINGIAHFAGIPIPKKASPLEEGEKLASFAYEVGTPDIPYTGDGTGFTLFDSTATTAICRGQRNYSDRYITEQIEGLDL